MKHLKSNYNIDSILRYILNNTDNNISINEGFKTIKRNVDDYINQYNLYNKNSLESISSYITTLFNSNNKTLEGHYERMKINIQNCKGISLYECENYSMEKYILDLFWEKMAELPISQNVLITNKETSSEEIQAFFHRSLLCNYNTLFVVEINDSFSEYKQGIMNSYIDSLLSYKNKKYNEETKENVDKSNTEVYLDSYIVFVYNKQNKNITSFLNEIKKLINSRRYSLFKSMTSQKFEKFKTKDESKNYSSELENILIISSDICGLGKSEKIKKMIKDNKKTYFVFHLGGILTKNLIFDKLDNLLNEIKNEIKKKNKL